VSWIQAPARYNRRASLEWGRIGRVILALFVCIIFLSWHTSIQECDTFSAGELEKARPASQKPSFRAHSVEASAIVDRECNFAFPGNAEAWAFLPARITGDEAPLPQWAKMLARTLPRTTAAMLELDFTYRTRSPLDLKLAALVRWSVSRANHCEYGMAYALADLKAAQVEDGEINRLRGDRHGLPEETRSLLSFVDRLSIAAQTITDEEVSSLITRYGEKQVVGIVFSVAYWNFFDRLMLALRVGVEPDGPLPPLAVRFVKRGFTAESAPGRSHSESPTSVVGSGGLKDPDWKPTDWAALQRRLKNQKARHSRISLPETDSSVNRWGLVGTTYQPHLATAWSACTQAFAEEADQDPIFEQSIFWVVTRTKQCFY
jgi:alkylhydroperoxidase family enzyme